MAEHNQLKINVVVETTVPGSVPGAKPVAILRSFGGTQVPGVLTERFCVELVLFLYCTPPRVLCEYWQDHKFGSGAARMDL